MIFLYNDDNRIPSYPVLFDLVYGDCVYESKNFQWTEKYWESLRMGGVFIIQTDWHTDAEYDVHMKSIGATLINKLVWKNEWGNHPKDRFHQCYDTILVYGKPYFPKKWPFHSEHIQVPKATVNTKLNPSGRQTKTATAWIDDICLTTTANERVKKSDGHNIRWQKPLALYDRIILPFVEPNAFICDPFMGSGSLGKWCRQHNFSYVGVEIDEEVFKLAERNIYER